MSEEAVRMPEVKITEARKKYEESWRTLMNEKRGSLRWYDCPICNNKGWIFVPDEYGYTLTRKCKCMPLRNAIKDIHYNGLDEQVKRCTFDAFKTNTEWQNEVKAKAEKFVNDENAKIFFIGGQSGSGKTHICTAIYGEIVKKRKLGSMYMLWNEKAKKMVSVQYEDEEEFEDILCRYQNTPVLYIDDFLKPFGEAKPSQGLLSIAYDIIDARIRQNGLITIISSEFPLREIRKLDKAIAGRIYESATDDYTTSIEGDDKDARVWVKLKN